MPSQYPRKRPARLVDPVKTSHPDVSEAVDWRDRGATEELSQDVWTTKNDFGAYTRFGLGWGPLEVQRSVRTPTERVLEVLVAGQPVAAVHVHGDHGEHTRVYRSRETIPAEALHPEGQDAGTVTVNADVLRQLRALSEVLQGDLTPARRVKRYFTAATLDRVDEVQRLLKDL